TYYTQQGKWDMAPGFGDGNNSRFSRSIEMECMSCHNNLPSHVSGSVNKYSKVPKGIECERCHGPGELHVREKLLGNLIDTSRYIDSTIVNPKDLTAELQMSLCQRCHLQGVAVLKDGKGFADFKPGMDLKEVMDVFLPNFKEQERFIMASQADRLRQSKCYIESMRMGTRKLTCLTCHNPHVSVKEVDKLGFNKQCLSCHGDVNVCGETMERRNEVNDQCAKCHMPGSPSIDIPHVSITDHKIGIPVGPDTKKELAHFLGLRCMTDDNPDHLTMAKGYLAYFEKFSGDPVYLDSCEVYLNKYTSIDQPHYFEVFVHFHYLKKDYGTLVQRSKKLDENSLDDGWTSYRIGEAYYDQADHLNAERFFRQAVKLEPYNLEFMNKQGSALVSLNRLSDAKLVFEKIYAENPKFVPALSNLGFVSLSIDGDVIRAKELYRRAIDLDPDYSQAILNLAGLYIYKRNNFEARRILKDLLEKEPDNEQARRILGQLDGI
ncbi:MAG: tetratricopeptide repeat protein, partial [Bacteroidetes bacterium]|nr:tetratricopeptide repeat protein [Bacteroidota bacterium]